MTDGVTRVKDTAKQLIGLDKAVTHAAARRDDGALVQAAGKASEIADQPPLVALSAATILVGAVLRRPAVVRSGVRMLASHAIATAAKAALKAAVDRTRPARALQEGHHAGKGSGTEDSGLNAFPSGHTAGAVAVAQAVATDAPAAALPLQAAAAGVAAVQPSRGKHYISDVVAGAVIGWASQRIASMALRTGEAGLKAAVAHWRKR